MQVTSCECERSIRELGFLETRLRAFIIEKTTCFVVLDEHSKSHRYKRYENQRGIRNFVYLYIEMIVNFSKENNGVKISLQWNIFTLHKYARSEKSWKEVVITKLRAGDAPISEKLGGIPETKRNIYTKQVWKLTDSHRISTVLRLYFYLGFTACQDYFTDFHPR